MRRTCLLRDRPIEIYTPLPPRRSLNHKDITACPLSDLTPSKSDDRNILKETVLWLCILSFVIFTAVVAITFLLSFLEYGSDRGRQPGQNNS